MMEYCKIHAKPIWRIKTAAAGFRLSGGCLGCWDGCCWPGHGTGSLWIFVIHFLIATGQAHGAIAQGVGQALLERAIYDPASGQLVAGSLMDYALPRADDLPAFDLGFNGTRCATNPLGVKGCGEAGAVGAFPAVTHAILDALAPLGVGAFTGPASPEHIWRALTSR